jgi:SAM-dependent methyltransferase
MSARLSQSKLPLGQVNTYYLQISPATLQESFEHAQQIAADLGSGDSESSLAAYWSLASRIQQWQTIVDRVGHERTARSRIVEVGSGMGLFVLAGVALGFSVLGIEASTDRYQRSLRIACALFEDNHLPPPFINGHAEALPLPAASVDLVASFQTLEHVRDVAQTLREIRRVLRPGGLFFAQVPNYTSLYEAHYGVLAPLGAGKTWLRRYLRLRGRPTGFLDHLQWIGPAMLRDALCSAGFSSAQVGRIARPTLAGGRLPATAAQLPFRFRRGAVANRAANGLALLLDRLGASPDLYPQIEIWAAA